MNAECLVIASRDGSVRALDARAGAARWTQSCGHPFGGLALARVADSIIAAALDGYLCALALTDGTVRWQVLLPDAIPDADPLVGLRVAACSDQVVVQHGIKCVGIDPVDGHFTWQGGWSGWSLSSRGWWVLAVGQANAYVLEQVVGPPPPPPADPRLSRPPVFITTALSTWDGTPQWGTRDQSAVKPGWDGAPSLAEADGVVYSYGQGPHALDAFTGERLWTREDVPRHHVGALALGREQVIVAAGGHLGAYRRDSGSPLWAETGQRRDGYFEEFVGVCAIGELVYAGRGEYNPRGFRLEARAGETGALRWSWPAESTTVRPDIAWRFCGAGDTLYIPSLDGLWGVRASDGTQLWHLPYPPGFDALLAIAASDA
jgi:outer membrane protein assembly factor BamB